MNHQMIHMIPVPAIESPPETPLDFETQRRFSRPGGADKPSSLSVPFVNFWFREGEHNKMAFVSCQEVWGGLLCDSNNWNSYKT